MQAEYMKYVRVYYADVAASLPFSKCPNGAIYSLLPLWLIYYILYASEFELMSARADEEMAGKSFSFFRVCLANE